MIQSMLGQRMSILCLALFFCLGLSIPAGSLAAVDAKQKEAPKESQKESRRPLRKYFKNVSNRFSKAASDKDTKKPQGKNTSVTQASDKKSPSAANQPMPPAKPPLLKRINDCFRKMTYQEKQASPWGMSYGVAAPNQGPAPTQGPCTPWYGYGMGVPTYDYGWFGATYRPAKVSHTGYYGGTYQWGYRRGY